MDRFKDLTINTLDELKEQVQWVLKQPDVDGFDAMIANDLTSAAGAEFKARREWALELLAKGVRLNIHFHQQESTATHQAARLLVIKPVTLGIGD